MSRLPGTPGAQVRKPEPDIYSALLLIGISFLLVACVCVFMDLTKNYGMSLGQLFSGADIPK